MLATIILAHSPHVILYDVMRVPDPDNTLVGFVPLLINRALSVIAALTFYRLARSFFDRHSMLVQCLLLGALWAMLNQQLLRNFIMDGVVSHDWIYCFVENLPDPLGYFAGAILIVTLCRLVGSNIGRLVGSLAIAAVLAVVIDPSLNALFTRLIASIEYLDTGNIYNPPYGWQVDVPSYLTYAEPVIASYAVAALTCNRLSARLPLRIAQFVLLVMSLACSIVPTLVYSFYQKRTLSIAIFSEGQFALQALVLSFMTAFAWYFSGVHAVRKRS